MSAQETSEKQLDKPLGKKQTPEKCDHAWILNVKPAVCLFCRERKAPRGKKP